VRGINPAPFVQIPVAPRHRRTARCNKSGNADGDGTLRTHKREVGELLVRQKKGSS